MTPLHLAVSNGQVDALNVLLDRGADTEAADSVSLTLCLLDLRVGENG